MPKCRLTAVLMNYSVPESLYHAFVRMALLRRQEKSLYIGNGKPLCET